ncbi:hypothetical protein FGB62_169g13 [Gracilaria domingensis]|nr:hypothetical protein FGB62_169g13 [Gracilaria domingensis]
MRAGRVQIGAMRRREQGGAVIATPLELPLKPAARSRANYRSAAVVDAVSAVVAVTDHGGPSIDKCGQPERIHDEDGVVTS